MSMKAIILAAGIGMRLKPITNNLPKCLIDINGANILERMIKSLIQNNIKELIIVTGHCSDRIEDFVKKKFPDLNVEFIFNEKFESTNNIYSLWMARDKLDNNFIQMDSDIICDNRILKNLIESKHSNCLAIDSSVKLSDEDMKVKIDNKNRVLVLNKKIDIKESNGEFIGIGKFSFNTAKILSNTLDKIIQNGNVNEYYEESYQRLINNNVSIYALDIKGINWIEIDTIGDVNRAKNIF